MAKIALRFDVDHVYGSHVLDYINFAARIRLRRAQFQRVHAILDVLEGYSAVGTFFFRPLYTLPTPRISARIFGLGNSIGLHADKTRDLAEMKESKKKLEAAIGRRVMGVTTHGHGILASGEYRHGRFPELAAEAGYAYDATSGPENPGWKPKIKRYNGQKLVLFGQHLTLDTLVAKNGEERAISEVKKIYGQLEGDDILMLLLHPRVFLKYPGKKEIKPIFEKILEWFNSRGCEYVLFDDVAKQMLREGQTP